MAKDNRFSLECPFLELSLRQELSARFSEDCSDREITLADMARINSDLGAGDGHLTLHGYRISSLLPLSVLSNLKRLFVNSSQIKDLSFLNELPSFCELDLGPALLPLGGEEYLNKFQKNPPLILFRPPARVKGSEMEIEDLSPLFGLNKLKALNFSSLHKVSDLSPLSGMKDLRSLRLSGYSLSDYSPLFKLPKLKELFLPFCQLKDPSPLMQLTNLKKLIFLRSNFTKQQLKEISKALPLCSFQSSPE